MANKKVGVDIAFNADTSKAKASIQELQTLLNKITYSGASGSGSKNQMAEQLQSASAAAKELQYHLNNAFNAKTGKLDLSLLDKSLASTNSDITKLSTNLLSAGTNGQQAFVKVAQAIAQAEQPMVRVNDKIKDFAVSLKNAAKYQLSNAIIQGFTTSLNAAVGYAKDLNSSLNEIRIVSGKGADEMARFAEEANKSAKRLSTTTTDYTKASLIYYQQGLSDQEVADRTETTIKMANVAGTSAQKVSDQMTAVWNNFYDGSKSLEYYSDVMVKLGAATASSTDEISEGVNKFAATAKTVGLSYEYAASALATVTARTRESADVVGNAMKTLFARIQGLNLGETLDDGTTLNKYSKALDAVGIDIKTQSGDLKDMDDILDELGEKWGTISRDQQTALAQTVAGVRQYSQLMALMNNWDYFKENLQVAYGSEGELETQAEIYAESWEAAEKRVKASMQGVYQAILDDKFFITLNNGFANALGGLEAFIEGAGGVGTIITGISSIIVGAFAYKVPNALKVAKYNFDVLTKGTQVAYRKMQEDMGKATELGFKLYNSSEGSKGINPESANGFIISSSNQLLQARNKLAQVSDKMNATDKQAAEIQLSLIEVQQKEVMALNEKNEALQKTISSQIEYIGGHGEQDYVGSRAADYSAGDKADDKLSDSIVTKFGDLSAVGIEAFQNIENAIGEAFQKGNVAVDGFNEKIKASLDLIGTNKNLTSFGIEFNKITKALSKGTLDFSNQDVFTKTKNDILDFINILPSGVRQLESIQKAINNLKNSNKDNLVDSWKALRQELKKVEINSNNVGTAMKGIRSQKEINSLIGNLKELSSGTKEAKEATSNFSKVLDNFNPQASVSGIQAITSSAAALGNIVTLANSLSSAISSLSNPDLTGWEKFASGLSSLAMIVPSAISMLSNLANVQEYITGVIQKNSIATLQNAQAKATDNATTILSTEMATKYIGLKQNSGNIFNKETEAILKKIAVEKLGLTTEEASILMTQAQTQAQKEHIILRNKDVTAILAKAAAEKGAVPATEAYRIAQEKLNQTLARTKTAMGAVSIILMALSIVWSVVSKIIENERQKQEKLNEEIKKTAETTNEQIKTNGELIDSYNDLMSSYSDVMNEYKAGQATQEDVINVQDQLKEKALEVAEALGLEGVALKSLQGDFKGIQKEIDKARIKEIEEAIADNEADQEVKGNAFIEAMRKGVGHEDKIGGTGYEATIISGEDNSNTQVYAVLRNNDYSHIKEKDGINGFNITAESMSAESYVEAYQEALDFKQKLDENLTREQKNENDMYNNLSSWLNKSKDAYDAYVASKEQIQSLKVESTALGTQVQVNGEEVGLRDISSVSDFDSYREQLINNIADTQKIADDARNENNQDFLEITKSVDAYLGTISSLSKYITQSKAFDDIAKQVRGEQESLEKAKDRVLEVYNRLDPEEKTLFFQIDFNIPGALENYKEALNYLKAKAKQEKIETQLEVVASGIELLDSGKTTTDDIIAWAQQMSEQGLFDENSLGDFLGGSSSSQRDNLIQKKQDLEAYRSSNRDEVLKGAEQERAKVENEINSQERQNQYTDAQDNSIAYSKIQSLYNEAVSQGKGATFDWEAVTAKEGFEGIASKEDFDQQVNDNQAIIDSYNQLISKKKEYDQVINEIGIEKQVEEAYGWRDALQEQAEALDINYDEVQDYADALGEQFKNSKLTRKELEQLALTNKRLEKGVKAVKENWSDFSDMMEETNGDFSKLDKTSPAVVKNFDSMRTALADILDWDASDVTDEMIEMAYSSGQLKGIMEGNAEALKEFQLQAANKVLLDVGINDESLKEQFSSLTSTLQSMADFDPITLEGQLNDEQFISACQDMINAAGMTVDQAQAYFDSLGYEADIEKETVPTTTVTSMRVPVFTISPDGQPTVKYSEGTAISKTLTEVLKIKSINKKSVGSGLGSSLPPSGGGGSSKDPKHAEKKNDSDKERYHTVLNQLEDLNSEYDDISKAKDRAFGKDRLKNMDEEIAKTDELIDKQKEYLDAIENYLPLDLAAMIGSYEDTIGGPSILFDEKGNISNFDEIQDAMFAKYNEMADAFDEDSTDWQIFEKKYEQLEKYIEQYEETYDLLRDQEQEYQDLINQRLDAQLEKVQYTVEVKLDVSEDQVKLLEYQLGRIEDDSFKSLEAIGLLTEKANELNKQIETNKQGLNDALNLSLSTAEIAQVMAGNLSVLTDKNFTDDQISAIKEYRDNILDLNGELDDLREEVESKLMDAFDAWQEKLEKGVDTLDHYGSILESYKNIIDIVGTDALGLNDEFMNDLAQGSVDNAINKLEAVKSEYRSIENARAEAEAKLKDAQDSGDTKSAEMWEQTLADLTEKSQEAQENMLSAWEDALDRLAEQFEQSAERIAESFNKSIYNLGGLEGLGNDFDKAQDRADIMLDDYQKIYELSKLSRDINKSIDDTDLIGGKEKLKKLLGDVNALQEDGVEMSQYDLEYLQKTYDLRLAELELEEAQRAKNTVRLSKDNEGNWSYIYTQNSDAVDQAQQKYEDALYAMQDLSSNYIDEMSEKLIDTSQEMAEALAELRIQDFASIDDYYAEVDRVQKYYQEQLDLQENELNKAILNNKTLYDEDWTAYHNATGYKISDTEDFVTAFKDSMLGTLMGSETDMSDFTEIIKGSLATMTEQLLQAADTYYRNLQEAMNAADTSIEDFGEDIGASIDEITAKSEEGASSVEDMADRMNTAVNDLMDTIQTWQESYGLAMEEIINDNLAVIESINELTKKLSLEDYDASVSWNLTRKDKDTPTGMASGGYTGSWGKEGKLGILHEKELVLNATDTANMLDMLQITRDMINTIDLQTQNAKLGLGELVASTIRDPLSEVLEQNVHITAEFPNVTDHNEIEQALLNLNNTASQYANRK